MQLKSNNNNGMLSSLTKSINANASAMMTIKTRIERTGSGRFVVKKANSVDDECSSSEAVSSCSDNDDNKLFAMTTTSKCHPSSDKCHNSSSMHSFDVQEEEEEEDNSEDSDADLMLDNIDVTFFSDDDNYTTPKNDAERMFFEVVESLRYEQEVRYARIQKYANFSSFALLSL